MKAATAKTEGVTCTSQRLVDGWTGERMGWCYGFHIIYTVPADGKCPTCGVELHPDEDEEL